MNLSIRTGWRIAPLVVFFGSMAFSLTAQNPPATNKPAAPPSKKPVVGPAAPQSRHYPILLIAQGSEPFWNLRLGMKGPERLERAAYPPIPLEPAEVEPEASGSSWIYHAKDSQTNAVVAVHVSREICSDGMSDTKYPFRVSLDHAQIGSLNGCARIAPDQFPEFKQKNLDDDDPEKKKPGPPQITNFKPPVVTAYLDPSGKVMLARNDVPKLVAPKGSWLSLSHDGKRLLYLRENSPTDRSLQLYDSSTGKSSELIRGLINYSFWSPDDSRIAFLKSDSSVWHIWTISSATSAPPAQLSPTPVFLLDGWADNNTLVAANSDSYLWIGADGGTMQAVSASQLCGTECTLDTAHTVRVSPVNPDLLLISAELLKPAAGSSRTAESNLGGGIFLYELRSKRRVLLSPANLLCQDAEWSRDGIQIFFTGNDSARNPAIYKLFWDGSGLKKIRAGSKLVIGQ